MHKIKELLYEELEKYEKKGELSAGSLDIIHKITDTIKNIDKIEMLEDGDYSEARGEGYSMARGGMHHMGDQSYDDGGSSYARRGTHYVRGHYSRDGGYGGEGGRSYRGGYNRDEGKDHLMRKLGAMMEDANEEQREIIRQCMQKLENA